MSDTNQTTSGEGGNGVAETAQDKAEDGTTTVDRPERTSART
jgi:hypothetical protein